MKEFSKLLMVMALLAIPLTACSSAQAPAQAPVVAQAEAPPPADAPAGAEAPSQPTEQIDSAVTATLERFKSSYPDGKELFDKSAAVLVFPNILKGGLFFWGGAYGTGTLLVRDGPNQHYNLASYNLGPQMGVQGYSLIMVFQTKGALAQFQNTAGWQIGVNGHVTVLTLGLGAHFSSAELTSPVLAFVFDSAGLMWNWTLEGSKITRTY